jgi:hypothetical protein
VTRPEPEFRLPPGYWLDRSDPDVWLLLQAQGWLVTYFSAKGATREAIEDAVWEAYRDAAIMNMWVPTESTRYS